jgi:hypothetical protein
MLYPLSCEGARATRADLGEHSTVLVKDGLLDGQAVHRARQRHAFCMVGVTCEYRSRVTVIVECPSPRIPSLLSQPPFTRPCTTALSRPGGMGTVMPLHKASDSP